MKPAVPPEVGVVRFSWTKSAWLWLNLIPALVALPRAGHALPLSLGLAFATLCVGHSVAMHRGVIHRTFEFRPGVRDALLWLFVFTGLGGPLSWIRLHHVRDHWQNQRDCPDYFAYRHGVLKDFWWNLHCSFHPSDFSRYGIPPALEADRRLRFLERTWPGWNLALFALLWALGGPEVALVAGFGRTAASILGHWWIGFVTHKHGERRFALDGAAEGGTNVAPLGWLSFGEGFHNNHHALPTSARMGLFWYELDLGWLTVLALERLGLIHAVRAWSRGNAAPKPNARWLEPPARPAGTAAR